MLGILLGLICLAFLTYKGMSILWVAPVSALVVAAFGGMNLLDAFTGDFMKLLADTLQVGFLCLCLAQYSEKLWRLRELRKV